ncbi:MAG: Gfo/Idh/MocA family oxidoreductase [Rhodothermales bacterium]|nr:Gfo/Idh/MocA family oxidoreductase [Rhodothermales bacterium]
MSNEVHVGIAMNGVTGRMGTNQHLMRSIVAIREQGGVATEDGRRIIPEPILVGRNAEKLEKLAQRSGVSRWTTDLDEALAADDCEVYFDAQATSLRVPSCARAIAAGKHIYCEKPTALTTSEAYHLYDLARKAGVKHGVVQDKLWLPGLMKVQELIDNGFFGRILSVRGEFGYWVFEGDRIEAQRPSWNYRKEDGGGIMLDMLCHWRYVLDNLFGNVRSLTCVGATHIKKRWDENNEPYECTADDAAYATFQLEDEVVAHFNSSWTVRVRRDDLLTMQIDGTEGSAVAGLRECYTQSYEQTPKPVWNPDVPQPIAFFDNWEKVEDGKQYDNAFKAQWELFLKHVVTDTPFRWGLLEGAKGVQLAELGLQSWAEGQWLEVPSLESVVAG